MRNTHQIGRKVEMSILGEGEIFGEDDIILQRNRQTTAICNSQEGIVLEINKKDFKFVILRDQYSAQWLMDNIALK